MMTPYKCGSCITSTVPTYWEVSELSTCPFNTQPRYAAQRCRPSYYTTGMFTLSNLISHVNSAAFAQARVMVLERSVKSRASPLASPLRGGGSFLSHVTVKAAYISQLSLSLAFSSLPLFFSFRFQMIKTVALPLCLCEPFCPMQSQRCNISLYR